MNFGDFFKKSRAKAKNNMILIEKVWGAGMGTVD